MSEREATGTGWAVPCPPPLPKPRRALPAAEWVWREKRVFPKDNQELFAAQFVLGKDLGDPAEVHEPVGTLSIDRDELTAAPTEGGPAQSVPQREIIERNSTFQARLRGWLLSD
jgi:hypothetical protein